MRVCSGSRRRHNRGAEDRQKRGFAGIDEKAIRIGGPAGSVAMNIWLS